MTTSTFEFDLGQLGTQMATRPNGQAFLNQVLFALETHHVVVLNFANRVPTPSFADQCVGGLAMHLGLESFKHRVKLKNVADSVKPLVKHVIISRSEMHKDQNLAHN